MHLVGTQQIFADELINVKKCIHHGWITDQLWVRKKKTLKFPFQREQTLANGRFKSIRGEMAERWKNEIYICLHEP